MLGTITLTVGQTDSVSQKDDGPETVEPLQEVEAPQVNEEKKEEEILDANEVTSKDKMEEEERKQDEASEVGFKKIFRFVGFKFTLKKDKTEKTEPVQLLTVKKEEGEPSSSDEPGETKEEESKGEGSAEEAKEEGAVEEAKEEGAVEEAKEAGVVEEAKEAGAAEEAKEAGAAEEAKEAGAAEEAKEDGAAEEAKEDGAVEEAKTQGATEEPKAEDSVKELALQDKEDAHEKLLAEEQAAECSAVADIVNDKASDQMAGTQELTQEATSDKEAESQGESPTSPPVQATQSPLRRFFTQGIFSNLRKKASFKKPREEEPPKEIKVEEEIKEAEETTETAAEEAEETNKQEMPEAQEEPLTTPEDTKTEDVAEQGATIEQKEDEIKAEVKVDIDVTEPTPADATVTLPVESSGDIVSTEGKAEDTPEGKTSTEDVPATIITEAELLSSQEKAKTQGSPLKKLLTGTGLKKLSSKKQKAKKEAEAKLTESGEQVSEQLQSSTESAEGQKGESSPSSPEESAEHVIGESGQAEAGPENESDAVTSDGERKKDGILPWASFKKLVTPKKRVKRSSESEDEGTEKPKSATLSSTDSAAEKQEEPKPTEEEQKTEVMTEEPKKKMDTSVSWEALICVGSSKKRARKTSDSDDEAPKIEEEAQTSGEEHGKTAESPLGSSQEADHENLSSPEQAGSPSEADGVSTWESLKRFVTPKRKVKTEDKVEELTGTTMTEQIPSDSEIPKEESSFSLKKLIPGRKKKKSDGKQDQVSSDEAGKDKGSAEEDSDTPAVVPLSEYESEQAEQVELTPKDKVEAVEKKTEIPEVQESKPGVPTAEAETVKSSGVVPTAGAHVKADIDERSPSWISPSAVEDLQEATECITKQPLSDIPEEGDTIATPKSTAEEGSRDDTIAEDIIELSSEAVTAVEQVPEVSFTEETTEMLSAVSRLTESPGTSGDMTPVQGEYEIEKTEVIVQEVVQTISAIQNVQSVTVSDVHREAVAVSSTPQVMESATKEKTVVLEPHLKSEAVAICTGLETQEIESAEEKTLQTSVESLTEVEEVLSTEIVVEDKTEKCEVAGVGEEHIFAAEVLEIKSEFRDPEPMTKIKETPKQVEINVETASEVQEDEVLLMGEVKDIPDPEFANVLQEQKAINVALVNLVLGETEVLEEPVVAENTPKTETEGPLETKLEESVCAESADVTEVASLEANKVQEFEGTKEDVADIEHAPLEEVVQCVVQEVTASMPEPPTSEPTEVQEAPIAVVAPATEISMSKEMVAIITPLSESVPMETADIKDEAPMERISSLKFADDHEVQVKQKEIDMLNMKPAVEADIEVASTTFSATVEDVCEKVENLNVMEAEQVKEQKITEEHSTTTVHLIIQNVVEDIEKPTKTETTQVQDTPSMESSLAEETSPTTTMKDKTLQDTAVHKKPEDAEPQVEEKADTEKTEDEHAQQVPAEEVKEAVVDSKMTEESLMSTVAEQHVKMVLEAVQVETMDTVQFKTAEECVVPVGIHQEDVSVQSPFKNKQEIDEMAQDGEMKVKKQQKVEKEGMEIHEKAKGEEADKAWSQEEKKPMVDIREKTESEEGKSQVEAEPKKPVRLAESVVAQESQEPEAVEATAVVTTGQKLICPTLTTHPVEKEEVVVQEESIKVETGPAPVAETQDVASDMVSDEPEEVEKVLKDTDEEVQLEATAVVTTVEILLCPAQALEEKVVTQEESTMVETEPESTSKTQTEESKAVSEEPKETEKEQHEATAVVTTIQTLVCPALPTQTVEKEEVAPQEKSTVVETEPESTSKTQMDESKAVSEKPKEAEKQEEQHEATAVVTTVQTLVCPALPTQTVEKEEVVPQKKSTVVETEPESTSKTQTEESKAISEEPKETEEEEQHEATAVVTTVQTLVCTALPTQTVEKEEVVPQEKSTVVETEPESTSKTQVDESKTVSEKPKETEKEKHEATAVVTTVQTLVCPALPTQTVEKEEVVPQEKSTVVETEPESTSKTQVDESKTVSEKPKETEKEKHEATAVVTTVQTLVCPALPTQTVEKEEVVPQEKSTVVETEPESTSKAQVDELKAASEKPEEDDQLEATAEVTAVQTSPGKTQADTGKDSDIPTKAADVKKEERTDQESAEKVKIQSAVVYAKGKVEVSEPEVIDHCESVEIVQMEAAVEFAVQTGKIQVEKGGAGSSTEPSSKDEVASADCKEAEHQKPEPSAGDKDACKLPKSEEARHQESLAGDAPGREVSAQNGTSSQPEGKDKSEEKGHASTESREEAKSKGEEVGEGQLATTAEAAGAAAVGEKAAELTLLKEALEITGDVLLETVSEIESVSSELTAAS
ncbi:A-kinase anchor protein 12b isoform X2 [Scleropages formosus]|uniref:A kinase (PRKA) anchor protein 12b n=1 Tax=Scleropages formosus TaxID=113540 RepID=A0A8C9S6F3_SCLFO|nr:A-kinase anchor protein 12 isoform X2 [Scleropages formosus]